MLEPSTAVQVRIRDASAADMVAVQRIYAHYVLHDVATFEETPPDTGELLTRRQTVLALGLPYLVAQCDGDVVGYCYASGYRARPAYRHSIENAVYIDHRLARRGIGLQLLRVLIARCEAGRWRQMVAVISSGGASIGLHERLGFHHVGTLRSVGFKFGRWLDTVLMQRALGTGDTTLPANVGVGLP